MKRTFGTGDDDYTRRKKNAFRYPKDPEAIIPQADKPFYIDKRAAHVDPSLRIKLKGMKIWKAENLRREKEIETALENAKQKVDNEDNYKLLKNKDMTINLPKDDYNFMDEEMEGLKKKKVIKPKNNMSMEVDDETTKNEKRERNKLKPIVRNKKKKNKNVKSHYIVNH
jgi:hypothetical protein